MVGSAGLEPAKPEGRKFTVSGNCRYTNYPLLFLFNLFKVAFPAGLEPATYALEERCSIQLSYGNKVVPQVGVEPTFAVYETDVLTVELQGY